MAVSGPGSVLGHPRTRMPATLPEWRNGTTAVTPVGAGVSQTTQGHIYAGIGSLNTSP